MTFIITFAHYYMFDCDASVSFARSAINWPRYRRRHFGILRISSARRYMLDAEMILGKASVEHYTNFSGTLSDMVDASFISPLGKRFIWRMKSRLHKWFDYTGMVAKNWRWSLFSPHAAHDALARDTRILECRRKITCQPSLCAQNYRRHDGTKRSSGYHRTLGRSHTPPQATGASPRILVPCNGL